MQIVIYLYDAMTALDAIGPYEVLAQLPGMEVQFVAKQAGLVRNDTRYLALNADAGIDDVDAADILLVPGGPGDAAVREDAAALDWVRRIHETTTWTTSVCTGSLILAAAGLLKDRPATTHWTQLGVLEEYGAIPTEARYVQSDKIITAAGVSAGIDMALELIAKIHGEDAAKLLQLGIEYDPAPPFDAGSPKKVPAAMVDAFRATFEVAMEQRASERGPLPGRA
jgi:transcriptional regulator GlxA family with amidase domain